MECSLRTGVPGDSECNIRTGGIQGVQSSDLECSLRTGSAV